MTREKVNVGVVSIVDKMEENKLCFKEKRDTGRRISKRNIC